MKKYIIMASVAALAIGLSSCSNFLDELPDNRTELNENNVGKILLSAYPTTAICEMGEMSSDNTDAYPNRFSSFNRLQEDLYKWADSAEQDQEKRKSALLCSTRGAIYRRKTWGTFGLNSIK